ncbi:hypothetical protein BS17DRAFT_771222 [Gyrodon lividus]|nr:hypothetical protein BS17DRAFT_771222 [Gyrodon lividus]
MGLVRYCALMLVVSLFCAFYLLWVLGAATPVFVYSVSQNRSICRRDNALSTYFCE